MGLVSISALDPCRKDRREGESMQYPWGQLRKLFTKVIHHGEWQ